MNDEWLYSKKKMTDEMLLLGYDERLADEIARNIKSPKAMDRMTSYLKYVKPAKVELVVDEMLAICSEINAWKDKKESEEANAAYNDWLNRDRQ